MKTDSEQSLKITLGGSAHQIDANTLINELIHFTTILNAVNDDYGKGNREIKIKVNALEKGSFVIDLNVIENCIGSLFSKNTVEYIAAIVTIFGGAFGLYKKFKGRKISKEEAERVKNEIHIGKSVEITNIVNVYNQPIVREAMSKTIETADADSNVEDINISGGIIDPITISREEFGELKYDDFANEDLPPQTREEEEDATLVIIAMRFETGGKWVFNWNGIRIQMMVKDDALMKEIDNGARFGKGDAIRVKMKIAKVWNKEYSCYDNRSYKIVAFYEHVKAGRQTRMPEL